jgi:hypothetical protein
MSPGHTTERVYKVLKAQIMLGERRAGERLDPARLAQELNASATPVRDALHQLLGERMVQAFPQRGFQVPTLSETGLRELYVWSGDLLTLLLRNWRGGAGAAPAAGLAGGDIAETAADLFDAIAVTLGTGEHRRAVRHASDRLHVVRVMEAGVLVGVEDEMRSLIGYWTSPSAPRLRAGLQRYHRRRLSAIPAIITRIVAE